MAYMRPNPPAVHQANVWWCWAACLQILNQLHPNKFGQPIRNQNAWIAYIQQRQNEYNALHPTAPRQYLNAQSGLNTHYLPAILNLLGMTGHYFSIPGDPPTVNSIQEKLQISYLLGAYPVPGGSHFIVINGIDDNRIYYYNPWASVGQTSAPFTQVQSHPLVIAWK